MNFRFEINIDNAAFEDGRELSRLLRKTANAMEGIGIANVKHKVYDINGNTVGEWELS